MLNTYIAAFMGRANYRLLDNGTYLGTIPHFDELEAKGATLEECRRALEDALEDRVLSMLDLGDEIPELGEG